LPPKNALEVSDRGPVHWLLELRLWGLGPELPLRPLAKLALSVTIASFGLVVCSSCP
jgi:hypothetical protein